MSNTPTPRAGSSSPHGGADSLEIKDSFPSMELIVAESNSALTEVTGFEIDITQTESNAAQTEAVILEVILPEETNAVQTETTVAAIRAWGSGSTDNDSSRTTPANANGQNDGVFSIISTNLALGDLTNPVELTTPTFTGAPVSGTFSAKRIRVWFNIGANLATADTIQLFYKIGAGARVAFYTHGTGAVNYNDGSFTFDVSALSLADLANLDLIASYTALVVAVPLTEIQLDAWCIEYEGII